MGLLDKIKNLFLEEEEDSEDVVLEEENKTLYEEPKDVLPKVMRDTIEEEKKQQEVVEVPQRKFNFPIDFEETETPSRVNNNLNTVSRSSNVSVNNNAVNTVNRTVTPTVNTVNREVNKKPVELYPKKEEVKFKQKFKPTPVISPVYGVLDKNYKKDEVREKSEEHFEMRRPSKKVDFETVRKKAFGNLSDEIKDNLMCENCELYKEAKRISEISKDDLLYDMLVDEPKATEELTIEKAYDNYEDFGVAYEPNKSFASIKEELELENDLDLKIDKTPELEEVTNTYEEELLEEPIIPSREEKNKDKKVDDDFFQLIDSMYKERVDE